MSASGAAGRARGDVDELRQVETKLKEMEARLKEAETHLENAKTKRDDVKAEHEHAKAKFEAAQPENNKAEASADLERAHRALERIEAEHVTYLRNEANTKRRRETTTSTPPTLDELLAQFRAQVEKHQLSAPTPGDFPMDLRFYPAERPAVTRVKKEITKSEWNRKKLSFLAPPGSGKTSSMFAVFSIYFGVYLQRTPPQAMHESFQPPFNAELKDVFAEFHTRLASAVDCASSNSYEKMAEALRISRAFVSAHLVALWLFLTVFPEANPYQSLQFQLTSEGNSLVRGVFSRLEMLPSDASGDLCLTLHRPLHSLAVQHGAPDHLVFGVDDIDAYSGDDDYKPLERAVNDLDARASYHQLYARTRTIYPRSVSFISSIGKITNEGEMSGDWFPLAAKDDVVNILGKVTGLSEQEILQVPGVSEYLVDARFRLTMLAADNFRRNAKPTSKARLEEAVAESIKAHKESLLESLRKRVLGSTTEDDKAAVLKMLHRMYVASVLTGGEMRFKDPAVDLCRVGVTGVEENDKFTITETFALETIEALFEGMSRESPAAAAFVGDLQSLEVLSASRSDKKGNLFAELVLRAFLRFDGMRVVDLSIVKNQNPPADFGAKSSWKGVKITCKDVAPLGTVSDAATF